MSGVFDLTIAGNPPSVNHIYRNVSVDRRVVTEAGKVWRTLVQIDAKAEMRKQGWQMTPAGEKVVVEIRVFWPTKRKRDVENIGKLLWDSLEGIVFENDQWLLPRYMDFDYDKQNPRVELKFYRLENGRESA